MTQLGASSSPRRPAVSPSLILNRSIYQRAPEEVGGVGRAVGVARALRRRGPVGSVEAGLRRAEGGSRCEKARIKDPCPGRNNGSIDDTECWCTYACLEVVVTSNVFSSKCFFFRMDVAFT